MAVDRRLTMAPIDAVSRRGAMFMVVPAGRHMGRRDIRKTMWALSNSAIPPGRRRQTPGNRMTDRSALGHMVRDAGRSAPAVGRVRAATPRHERPLRNPGLLFRLP